MGKVVTAFARPLRLFTTAGALAFVATSSLGMAPLGAPRVVSQPVHMFEDLSLPSDMADRWAMDEGSGTSLTNGVSGAADGTLSGGTGWVSGQDGTGSAVQFDGVDGLGSIEASSHQQQTAMTVTFWARSVLPGPDRTLVALTGSDCLSPWKITTGASGSLAFSAQLADGRSVNGGSSSSAESLWDGQWHFLAVTIRLEAFDGQFNTWIDGIGGGGGVISGAALVDYSHPGLGLLVGGPRSGCEPASSFAGAVDDVRVYERVLSADEIGAAVPQIPTTIDLFIAPTFEYCDSHVEIDVTVSPRPANGGWVDLWVDDGSGPVAVSSNWWSTSSGTIWNACFPVGNDTLSATFRGVAPFLGSSSDPVPITVTKRHSKVVLQTWLNPVPSDMKAILSIDAEPGSGAVSVYEVTGGGHELVATAPPGSSYAYVGGLSVGTHDFQAEYAGDAQTLPSVSAVLPVQVVEPAFPTASISRLPATTLARSIAISWSGSPGWSPVASYDLRYRRAAWNAGFGSYTMLLSATTKTSTVIAAARGYTYCVSARSRDLVGHLSAWTADTCTVVPLDDRSLAHSGSWTAATGRAYYLTTVLRSKTYGSRLTRTGVVAKRLALVATTCPTCGSVRVYWGGTLLRRISLYSPTVRNRQVIPIVSFSSGRRGTLMIRVVSIGKTVLIDGLAVKRL